ncbi:hypothetical protein [Ekhidna sp.]
MNNYKPSTIKNYKSENDALLGEKIQNYIELMTGHQTPDQMHNGLFLKNNSSLFGVVINQYVYYLWKLDTSVKKEKYIFLKYFKLLESFSNKYCAFYDNSIVPEILKLEYLGLQERTIHNQSEIVTKLRQIILYIKEPYYLQIYLDNIISSKNFVFSQEIDYWKKTSNSENSLCDTITKIECMEDLKKLIVNIQNSPDYDGKAMTSDGHIEKFFCNIRILYSNNMINLNRCI